MTVAIDPIERAALPTWIAQRLAQQGQRVASGEAGQRTLQFFADRVEGNLLAAHQEIQKLGLLQPEGELSLDTRGLAVQWLAGRLQVDGRAEATARHVSSRLSTLRPMGSYRLTMTGGDAVALELSTLEGSLLLSGSGQWVGGRLRFAGEASAAPGLEAQLANLLNIIGRRQGDRAIISFG